MLWCLHFLEYVCFPSLFAVKMHTALIAILTSSLVFSLPNSLTLLTCLLIIVILSYTTVTVPVGKMILNGAWSNNTIVTKSGAVFQIFIWLLTYVTFLHLNKSEGVAPAG